MPHSVVTPCHKVICGCWCPWFVVICLRLFGFFGLFFVFGGCWCAILFACTFRRLYLIQNAAVRVQIKTKKEDYIISCIHWVPVWCRINFKALPTVCTSPNGFGPKCNSYMFDIYNPGRSLRPTRADQLVVKRSEIHYPVQPTAPFSYAFFKYRTCTASSIFFYWFCIYCFISSVLFLFLFCFWFIIFQ